MNIHEKLPGGTGLSAEGEMRHMRRIIGTPKEYAHLIVGNALYGLGFNLFFRTNDIAAGGFGGLGMVVNYYLPFISIGTAIFLMSVPVFLWSFKLQGAKYTLSALLSTVACSVFTDLFAFLPNVTENFLMAAILGGALYGVASMTLVRGRVAGRGTDLLGRLLITKFRVLSLGSFVLIVDGIVVLLSILTFGNLETGVYSVVAIVVYSIVTDRLINGFNRAFTFQVITSVDPDMLCEKIFEKLDRGATLVAARGMYSHEDRNMLYVAVSRSQIYEMKDILHEYAPDAFVMLMPSNEIMGEGFRGVDVTVPLKELEAREAAEKAKRGK